MSGHAGQLLVYALLLVLPLSALLARKLPLATAARYAAAWVAIFGLGYALIALLKG